MAKNLLSLALGAQRRIQLITCPQSIPDLCSVKSFSRFATVGAASAPAFALDKHKDSKNNAEEQGRACSQAVPYIKIFWGPEDLTSEERLFSLFETWMETHKIRYKTTDEKMYRFQVFRKNMYYIDEFNKGGRGCKLGPTQFTATTEREIKNKSRGAICGIEGRLGCRRRRAHFDALTEEQMKEWLSGDINYNEEE